MDAYACNTEQAQVLASLPDIKPPVSFPSLTSPSTNTDLNRALKFYTLSLNLYMLETGAIKPTMSHFNSPIWLVINTE